MNNARRWLRIRDAAHVLNVSESTIGRWLVSEKLDGWKVDNVVRVDANSVEKLIKTHSYIRVHRARQQAALSRWRRLRGLAG
jgi:excisionase family DNA binding protein